MRSESRGHQVDNSNYGYPIYADPVSFHFVEVRCHINRLLAHFSLCIQTLSCIETFHVEAYEFIYSPLSLFLI